VAAKDGSSRVGCWFSYRLPFCDYPTRFRECFGFVGVGGDVEPFGDSAGIVQQDGATAHVTSHGGFASAGDEHHAYGSDGVAGEFGGVVFEAGGGAVPESAYESGIALRVGHPGGGGGGGVGEGSEFAQGFNAVGGGFEARDIGAWIGRPFEWIGQGSGTVDELHDAFAGVVDGGRSPSSKPM